MGGGRVKGVKERWDKLKNGILEVIEDVWGGRKGIERWNEGIKGGEKRRECFLVWRRAERQREISEPGGV